MRQLRLQLIAVLGKSETGHKNPVSQSTSTLSVALPSHLNPINCATNHLHIIQNPSKELCQNHVESKETRQLIDSRVPVYLHGSLGSTRGPFPCFGHFQLLDLGH